MRNCNLSSTCSLTQVLTMSLIIEIVYYLEYVVGGWTPVQVKVYTYCWEGDEWVSRHNPDAFRNILEAMTSVTHESRNCRWFIGGVVCQVLRLRGHEWNQEGTCGDGLTICDGVKDLIDHSSKFSCHVVCPTDSNLMGGHQNLHWWHLRQKRWVTTCGQWTSRKSEGSSDHCQHPVRSCHLRSWMK